MTRRLRVRLEAVVLDAINDRVVQHALCADDAHAARRGRRGRCGGGRRRRIRRLRSGLEMDDAVLAPLVLLHRLFTVELLVANVAFERSIVSMRSFVHL